MKYIISILIGIIISLSSYCLFLYIKNTKLESDNIVKTLEVNTLKSSIERQNKSIQEMKVDYEKSISIYKNEVDKINNLRNKDKSNINNIINNIRTDDKCIEDDLLIKSLKNLQG